MDFSTIILRFRDLGRADGETILLHNKIITESDYTWWGWWKKANETTPIDEFGILSSRANSGDITVFLMDSGQHKLYKATCKEIKAFKEKSRSPEPEKTPDYYNTEEFNAWFKFTSVEECNIDDIRNYTYVNIEGFFGANEANYSSFENKSIYSIKELIQQERTVWFVRQKTETDKDFEIVLLNSEYVQPTNFSEKYYQSYGDSFLWLSDLHLASTSFRFDRTATSKTLASHITDVVNSTRKKIAGLIVTGDITTGADKTGFDRGELLFKDLNSSFTLNSENIAMCPGNHDFSYNPIDLNKDDQPNALSSEYAVAYKEFYEKIYHIKPNDYFACGKKILLSSGITVEIVCLNSLYLQQYNNFNGHGYISEEQLNYVEKEMGWNNRQAENTIRIAIMHHHYLPVCKVESIDVKRPSSVVYDADRLMKWLIKNDVKVLLHGHKHTSFHAHLNYPIVDSDGKTKMKGIAVVGLGSSSSNNTKNVIALLGIGGTKLRVTTYELFSDESTDDVETIDFTIPLGVTIE